MIKNYIILLIGIMFLSSAFAAPLSFTDINKAKENVITENDQDNVENITPLSFEEIKEAKENVITENNNQNVKNTTPLSFKEVKETKKINLKTENVNNQTQKTNTTDIINNNKISNNSNLIIYLVIGLILILFGFSFTVYYIKNKE